MNPNQMNSALRSFLASDGGSGAVDARAEMAGAKPQLHAPTDASAWAGYEAAHPMTWVPMQESAPGWTQ